MRKLLTVLLVLSAAVLLSGMSFRSGMALAVPIAKLDDATAIATSAVEKWGFTLIETQPYPHAAGYRGFRTAIEAHRPAAKYAEALVLRVEYNSARGLATISLGRPNVTSYTRAEQAIAHFIWSELLKRGIHPTVRYAHGLRLPESAP